jgi:hypothetical protein
MCKNTTKKKVSRRGKELDTLKGEKPSPRRENYKLFFILK